MDNNVKVTVFPDKLVIGESPRLVVDLSGKGNYIETEHQRIPYKKQIRLSRDLLEGKRGNVLQTAAAYYYEQACGVARGYQMLEELRRKANTGKKASTGKEANTE